MKRLTCDIQIGKFQFDFVTEVEIQSTWKRLTDTATIQLPRKIVWKGENLRDVLKRGDEVNVSLGWDFDNRVEFQGYISEIGSRIPVEFKCEDEMWKLKQTNITKAWRSVSLKTMLGEILPIYEIVTVDAELGPFRISKVSAAKVLESLQSQYGFYSFFRGKTLYVGFPYTLTESTKVVYEFEKNIIADNLVYRRLDDIKIKVRAVSLMPDGSQEKIELGDDDGELRTLHFYNLSRAQLRESAQAQIERLKYPGYKGSFETFGVPFIQHGNVASIRGGEYPERAGDYLVDAVRTRFGQNGFKRDIELGKIA